MDAEVVGTAKKIALRTAKYDHIFYINPEFPIVDDGVRSTNVEFQR
jgi:nicotinamide riboside kinase